MARVPAALALAAILTACAHWPATPKLDQAGQPGYRVSESARPGQANDILFVLAISGGGTRAAALGYGVMEELRRTDVMIHGQKRRLLDEVDVISAVSGGSLPAAYYGLRGDKTFDEFESKVLYRNLEHDLVMRILTPTNWFRLGSGTFGRSDLFAEIYDDNVFDHATFADLKKAGGPFVVINGTDITTGARFSFTQEYFDAICADLSKMTLGRAIATTTALPPLLTPMTFENRGGTCGRKTPSWAATAQATATGETPGRALLRARALQSYENPKRPYIHLFDGGLSENLGLNELLMAFEIAGVDAAELPRIRDAKKVVVVIANAVRFPEKDWDQSPEAPGKGDLEGQMWSIPVDRISLNAVEETREKMKAWEAAAPGRRAYLMNVTFDNLANPEERGYFNGVATRLKLPKEQVDKVREVGGRLLREAPAYQRLLTDLKADQ
jgi:NTE family protein